MKKILTILVMAMGLAFAASCSKSDTTEVTITFNGKTYTNARLYYVDQSITEDVWTFSFMLNPNSQDMSMGSIVYTLNDKAVSFWCYDPDYRSTVVSGTKSITKDGQNYNININGTDAAGKAVVFQGTAVYATIQ